MIQFGNPKVFAIESEISIAYASLGMRALGYFVLHVGGQQYGVKERDASLLACSVDSVDRRIAFCGKHAAFFAHHTCAAEIVDAVYGAVYGSSTIEYPTLGRPKSELFDTIQSNQLIWAPDGDQAFDDGSYVLHFDIEAQVRLIGFRVGENARHDPTTLSDIQLPANEFYQLLKQWRSAFEAAWLDFPKGDANVSVVPKMPTTTTIYVRLLDEGTDVFRPTTAHDLGGGVFKVLPSPDYDPDDEKWEFIPGTLVRCEKRRLEDDDVFVAIKA